MRKLTQIQKKALLNMYTIQNGKISQKIGKDIPKELMNVCNEIEKYFLKTNEILNASNIQLTMIEVETLINIVLKRLENKKDE